MIIAVRLDEIRAILYKTDWRVTVGESPVDLGKFLEGAENGTGCIMFFR